MNQVNVAVTITKIQAFKAKYGSDINFEPALNLLWEFITMSSTEQFQDEIQI